MRISTLIAFLIGLGVFFGAAYTSTKNPFIYMNAHAALVVFGGTFAAAAISFGFGRLVTLARVLFRRVLGGSRHYDPQSLIKTVMVLSDIYRSHPDRLGESIQDVEDPFLSEALRMVVENYLPHDDINRLLITRTASIHQRYQEEAIKFKALAKFPPAFGLMGAVMGMISSMSEIGAGSNSVGPSLALALVGTLYGVALANLVILPLAENLLDSAREVKAKNLLITEAVGLMLQKKNPVLMAEDLNSFLLASERLDWRETKNQKRAA